MYESTSFIVLKRFRSLVIRYNNIFTILNIAVVVFVTVAGFIKADPHNWSLDKEELPKDGK